MKIVQVMPEFGLAGAEIMCENLTYELTKMGHSVTVISMYDYHSSITTRLEKEGIDVRYLAKKPGLDLSMVRKIKKILKETNADVVHTHRYCAQYAVPAAILAGVKHRVHTIHNIAQKENGRLARKLNRFFFKHCHVIPVALSELIRESIVKEYRIEKEKIHVVFNGIDLSRCIPKDDYTIKDVFKILHIGRFSTQKNHIGLLKAFQLFHDKYSDSELWLIGDGEKKNEIEQYVQDNNLENNVRFLGLQENVYEYLHNADVFVLPSNYEGIPMTLIEAMGTGLPIVATNVGGIPDMLTNGVDALIVKNDSSIINAAFEMFYNTQEKRQEYGKNAKLRAAIFSSAAMGGAYVGIYEIK